MGIRFGDYGEKTMSIKSLATLEDSIFYDMDLSKNE